MNIRGRSFPSSSLLFEYYQGGDIRVLFYDAKTKTRKVIKEQQATD